MRQRTPRLAAAPVRYALWGIGLGIVCSLGGTWLVSFLQGPAGGGFSPARQGGQLFHWMLHTCPLLLGAFGTLFGWQTQAARDRDQFFALSLDLFGSAGFDGYFRQVNPACERMFGLTTEEMKALPFLERVHPDDRDATIAATQQLASGKDVVNFENRFRCKDGTYKYLSWRARPVEELQAIYFIAIDVSEEKRTEGILQAQIKEITGVANALAVSVQQIMASLAQTLAGTSETATVVSQTVATLEKVKQMAVLSSRKAGEVANEGRRTTQVSETGELAVEKARTGMVRAREQMDSIAQSAVRLGEQSQAIGDIIRTVKSLAEQSNLLAVNAAIEAAKAGEHGKGFAIVAREVRLLAEQSKQATSQVQTLLQDIQKAGAQAVTVTEQGVRTVELGIQQALEAGESIRTLADQVRAAAQVLTYVATTNQQQLAGIEQVTTAMESVKQATSQNVSGMEQIDSVAKVLHQSGQKLSTLIERYEAMRIAKENSWQNSGRERTAPQG
jgi:PAS domain S-box-containing protein